MCHGISTGTRRKKSFVAYILEMLTECNIVSLTTVSQTLNCVNKVIIWTLAVIWLQQSFAEPLKGLVTIPRIILWEVTSGHVRHHLFTQISELIIEPLMSKLILVSCSVIRVTGIGPDLAYIQFLGIYTVPLKKKKNADYLILQF